MKTYLKIVNQSDGKIVVSARDGVFSYVVTCKDKDGFIDYCEERKDAWLNSTLGNFDNQSEFRRRVIADKWKAAKELSEGCYDYYFNLESIESIFRKEVAELAKNLGIENYVLELHNDKYEDNKKR